MTDVCSKRTQRRTQQEDTVRRHIKRTQEKGTARGRNHRTQQENPSRRRCKKTNLLETATQTGVLKVIKKRTKNMD